MRSLLLRIFLSFWLIITITIVTAGALGYAYAERARTAMQNFEVSDAMLAASEALRRFGGQRPPGPPARGNLRPARPFTQLIGPDQRVYTVFVLPPQTAVGRWLAERGRITLAILALIVSAAVS